MRHLVFGLLFVCSSLVAQPLKSGDLLFVSSAESGFEQAIAAVTQTEQQRSMGFFQSFAHIAIVNVTDSGVYVLEAAPKHGVIYRSFAKFEHENITKSIFIGRLKPQYQQWIPKAIAHAYSHIGKPYNFAFDFDNDEYYCSELIYVAFAKASGKPNFFETSPMTFKCPNRKDFFPFWVDYFAKLNVQIPEGKPGLNPNGMTRSKKLEPLTEYVETHGRASLQPK
ncbi:MAG: hypothetical protein LBH22_09330 [Bacteroidales bacterium]|jgi:hypothetical protein|nr:hypothetical protein [Bacteroidales bacterium]